MSSHDTDETTIAPADTDETSEDGSNDTAFPGEIAQTPPPEEHGRLTIWTPWYEAFKQVLPIYLAVRVAFFVVTCLSFLFLVRDFSWGNVPNHNLWHAWIRKDANHFIAIATNGYTESWRTAFFPFYPILERGFSYLTGSVWSAGFLISNLASLVMLVVLYQLVKEDFGAERADRSVLYLSLFPTAFFLVAPYSESLFLCLIILGFYQIRHGNWWLAGLLGLLAGFTRSIGVLFALPFFYEYLRQHDFRLRAIRFDILAAALIPLGVVLFSLYCYLTFHDFQAFSHAQAERWGRAFHLPWIGMLLSLRSMHESSGFLSFQFLRNLIEFSSTLLGLVFVFLCFIGPWSFKREQLAYAIYAAAFYLFFISFPIMNLYPLESMTRYTLELFPFFIILAALGRKRSFHLNYLFIAGAILFFLLTQYLNGHWIT